MAVAIRKSAFARWAGVSAPAITNAAKPGKALHDALSPDGWIYRDHPAAQRYVYSQQRLGIPTGAPPIVLEEEPETPATVVDPFAAARSAATVPVIGDRARAAESPGDVVTAGPETPPDEGPGSPATRAAENPEPDAVTPEPEPNATVGQGEGSGRPQLNRNQRDYLEDVAEQVGLGHDGYEDLAEMSLGEAVARFGTFAGMREITRALKDHADMQNKQGIAAVRRGDHVPRDVFTKLVFPFIDLAFTRIVTEAPQALAEQCVARVMSGGDDLKIDVEEILRDELSGILGDCQGKVLAELEALNRTGRAAA